MRKITSIAFILLICCCSLYAKIGSMVTQDLAPGDFQLVYQGQAADILYDANDYQVVEIAVNLSPGG